MAKVAELLKLETRQDAEVPQEEKYPSGTVLFLGVVLGQNTPTVGSPVYMAAENSFRGFRTSTVEEIIETTDEYVEFKTRNSKYRLIWVPSSIL